MMMLLACSTIKDNYPAMDIAYLRRDTKQRELGGTLLVVGCGRERSSQTGDVGQF